VTYRKRPPLPCHNRMRLVERKRQGSGLAGDEAGRRGGLVAAIGRPQKITFGEMRESGVRGVLILQ
jgi:hypothetical protein